MFATKGEKRRRELGDIRQTFGPTILSSPPAFDLGSKAVRDLLVYYPRTPLLQGPRIERQIFLFVQCRDGPATKHDGARRLRMPGSVL